MWHFYLVQFEMKMKNTKAASHTVGGVDAAGENAMDLIFCTLFDSNYLDKGITLYQSMKKCLNNFKLYVFAFDERCCEILKKENLENVTVVSLKQFETEELLKVKKERTAAEYCWTCSPWIIKHVIEEYQEHICTYIDADMQFFSSPQPVFDEMRRRRCSAIIVPHRFKNEKEEKEAHEKVGSYCVEFNTFVNDENGRKILDWWADRCLEWCFYAVPGTTQWYGDQKYLNVFPEKFEGVMICTHYGVGMAPWNADLVDYAGMDDKNIPHVIVKATQEEYPVVIYHFENVTYLSKHVLHASSRMHSKRLHAAIYDPYIRQLTENRKMIENKYGFMLSKEKRVVTGNPFVAFYQKFISPFRRVKHLRDLYWV